ncbi:MAG TPA: L,D-transpeptidase [Thermoleophilaceae bacterium]
MSLARLTPVLLSLVVVGCGSGDVKDISQTQPAAPAQQAKKADVIEIPIGPGHLAAMSRRRGLTLRDRPGGKVVAHLRPRTEWGSPTVVWAPERRGRWLGVVSTAGGNNRIAWVDVGRDRPRMWRSLYSLHADLSARTLELWRGSRVVRRMPVGIGGPDTPTPSGRFTVTDKLIPARGLSFYGCCLLALSGKQPHLRPGWAGGDRIAIHGGSVGGAASAGCLHANDADLKRLMRVIPIGTPVYIKA